MNDPRFNEPDLTAEQLGELMGLTVRQVKDRVAKGTFVCHWRGNHRGMRFTPEDVAHNRGLGASTPAAVATAAKESTQLLKGVARLHKSRALAAAATGNA